MSCLFVQSYSVRFLVSFSIIPKDNYYFDELYCFDLACLIMGNVFKKVRATIAGMSNSQSRIVMVGLDNSGKTTILYRIKLNEKVVRYSVGITFLLMIETGGHCSHDWIQRRDGNTCKECVLSGMGRNWSREGPSFMEALHFRS